MTPTERTRKWRLENPERRKETARRLARKYRSEFSDRKKKRVAEISRKHQLKKKYGLSVEQYTEMRVQQGDRCAICYTQPKRLVVDHNHTTGKVRALLCDNCNFALGHLQEDPARIEALKQYVFRFKDTPHV